MRGCLSGDRQQARGARLRRPPAARGRRPAAAGGRSSGRQLAQPPGAALRRPARWRARARGARRCGSPDNLLGAALAVAIVVRGKGPTGFDAGRAAQNMMLAASGRRDRLVPQRHRRPRRAGRGPRPRRRRAGRDRHQLRLPGAPGRPRAPHARRVDRARRPAAVRRGRRAALVGPRPNDERPDLGPGRPPCPTQRVLRPHGRCD